MIKGENIYRRKDGRWEGRYKKGYDQNKRIRYGYCYGHSYREVKEKLNLAKVKQVQFSYSTCISKDSDRKNFETYCEQWRRIHENRLKKSTLSKYDFMLKNHIIPGLGNLFIEELTSDKIAEFSNELLYKKQLSVKTVRDILTFVHEIVVYIQQTTDKMCPVTFSYPKVEPKDLRVLSIEEQQLLTGYLLQELDIYKFSVLLALSTGLRIGEICALQWKHVNLKERYLLVKHTLQRVKNSDDRAENKTILLLGTPKTDSSVRTIPITDSLTALFEIFQAKESDFFILTGSEHFREPRKLQRKLQIYTAALGLQDVHFHTLRHTFATRCVEVGCDTKTLSEILGHSNISMTMNRYVHPSLELKRKNMIKLEQSGLFPSLI